MNKKKVSERPRNHPRSSAEVLPSRTFKYSRKVTVLSHLVPVYSLFETWLVCLENKISHFVPS